MTEAEQARTEEAYNRARQQLLLDLDKRAIRSFMQRWRVDRLVFQIEDTMPDCDYCGRPFSAPVGAYADGKLPTCARKHAPTSPEMAVVFEILKDLTDRRGLRQEWEQIDTELQIEIENIWAAIIKKTMRPS